MPRILKTTMRDKNIINLSLKVSNLLGGETVGFSRP
jgi:hypothetical protein